MRLKRSGRLLALFNSSDKGIRANAAGILGGYDESVRAGGRAGDAGKNFIYNVMSRNGTADPFDIEMALEGGFAGKMGNGKMIGPELIKQLKSQYGGMGNNAMASATKGLFGGSATVAAKVIDLLENNPSMGNAEAAANLNNAAQELIGDNMLPIMTQMKTVLGDLTDAINRWVGGGAAIGNAETVKELNSAQHFRSEAKKFEQWGINAGKSRFGKGYGKEKNLRGIVGDSMIDENPGYPGAEYVDPMSHAPGDRKVDSEFMRSVSDLAGKHKIKYMAPASERGGTQQIGITGGSAADAEKFSKAVDKLANMAGFKVDVKVAIDKNGSAIPRPAHNR